MCVCVHVSIILLLFYTYIEYKIRQFHLQHIPISNTRVLTTWPVCLKVQLNARGNSYGPDVTACPVKGPASAGPTPGPAAEPPGPFHSGPVVVSRVHRPTKEAFHSCFGTRNALVDASERRETARFGPLFGRGEKDDGHRNGGYLAPFSRRRRRRRRAVMTIDESSRNIVLRTRPASSTRGPALLSEPLLRTHPGMQWGCAGAFFCLSLAFLLFFSLLFFFFFFLYRSVSLSGNLPLAAYRVA